MAMSFCTMVLSSILGIALLVNGTKVDDRNVRDKQTSLRNQTAAPRNVAKSYVNSMLDLFGKQIPNISSKICPPLCLDDLPTLFSEIPQQLMDKVTTLCKGSSSQCQTIKNVIEEFKPYPVDVITKVIRICTNDPDVCTLILTRLTPLGHLPFSVVKTALEMCDQAQIRCKDRLIDFLSLQDSQAKPTQAVQPETQATLERRISSQPSKGASNSSHVFKALAFLNVMCLPLILAIRYGI